MSILQVNTIQNTSGVEVYTAKAWVNFNGTGVVAIRAAGNVSSITDEGVGRYIVNFATPMPDVNFTTNVNNKATTDIGSSGLANGIIRSPANQTTSVSVGSVFDVSYADSPEICVVVFR